MAKSTSALHAWQFIMIMDFVIQCLFAILAEVNSLNWSKLTTFGHYSYSKKDTIPFCVDPSFLKILLTKYFMRVPKIKFLKEKVRIFNILGNYTTVNHFRRDFVFYPTYNQNIKRLSESDERMIDMFHFESYYSPIAITDVPKMGLGAVASRDVHKS